MRDGLAGVGLLNAALDFGKEVEVLHRLLDGGIGRKLLHCLDETIFGGLSGHKELED
jgi:hypothetical protein